MLALALLMLAIPAGPADSTGPGLNRQVITAQAIREAGLVRPGDLLLLMDGWAFRSIDGFHVEAVGGITSPLGNRWSLWVDGQRVPEGVTGGPDLNLLPVSLHEIDSVEVWTGPVVFAGEFAGQGLVHIHTRRPGAGMGARVEYGQGNETGDPGPLRYFGDRTNVDKLGPDLSASAAYGSRSFHARVSALSRDHHPTDLAILPRLQGLAVGWPSTTARGYAGRVEAGGAWGRQAVSVLASRATDFIFVAPFGRELPATPEYASGGLEGTFRLGSGLRLRNAVQLGRSRLLQAPNQLDFDPGWQRDDVRGLIEVEYGRAGMAGALGLRGVREHARAERLGLDARTSAASAHGRVLVRPTEQIMVSAAVQSAFGADASRGAVLSGEWTAAGHRVRADLSYGRRSFGGEHPLWHAVSRGYALLDSLGIAYRPIPSGRRPVQASVDLGWAHAGRGGRRLEAGVLYRWTDGLTLETQAIGTDPAGPVFVGPVDFARAGGHVLGARLGGRSEVTPTIRQSTTAAVRLVTAGDASFRTVWERWPAVLAQTSWTYAPAPSFSLTARVSYRSGTTWQGGADGVWLSISPAALLDLSAVKTFWDGRVVADVAVRNAANRRYRLHPRGETQDLSLYARLLIRLGA